MTKEEKIELAKARWQKQPEIRAEFNNDEATFLAYVAAEADGLFKTFSNVKGLSRVSIPTDGSRLEGI
jgi:hypothetical protein